jgi:hypothetical protein
VARQPSGKGSAAESGAPLDEAVDRDAVTDAVVEPDDELDDAVDVDADADDDTDAAEAGGDAAETTRSIASDKFWTRVRVQPIEVALPAGVGYTLRAYRLSTELTPTEVQPEEDEYDAVRGQTDFGLPGDDEDDDEALTEEEMAEFERSFEDDELADEELADTESREAEAEAEVEADDDDDDEPEDKTPEVKPEEVPAFLSHRGRLLLFRSPEGLAEFVRSPAEHDLTQLDTWDKVRERISAADIVPNPEDRYELDLVVENLRGGPDVWDVDLLIQAGEFARDTGYALRMKSVIGALAAGSPLDDLDEALRGAASGGIGGFFARRRLRKIGAQQAAIGWRTIIGKISAAVDWRD